MPPLLRRTAAVFFFGLLSTPLLAETLSFTAHLSTASEVPMKSGTGQGEVSAHLNTTTSLLDYTITYTGLSGPATAAHFHGPAGPMETAGVAVKIGGDLSSPIRGSATLTPEQVSDLKKGSWYVNVHTRLNPSGEIRGQLTPGH